MCWTHEQNNRHIGHLGQGIGHSRYQTRIWRCFNNLDNGAHLFGLVSDSRNRLGPGTHGEGLGREQHLMDYYLTERKTEEYYWDVMADCNNHKNCYNFFSVRLVLKILRRVQSGLALLNCRIFFLIRLAIWVYNYFQLCTPILWAKSI